MQKNTQNGHPIVKPIVDREGSVADETSNYYIIVFNNIRRY